MRSLNKKVKALFLLISFAAYMPISIAPSLAIPADNQTPIIDNAINGGNIGLDGKVTVGGKEYDNFKVEMAPGAGQGAVALYNWGSFDVGKNVAVNWVSNAWSQKFINRVMNTGKASEIFGALTSSSCANGKCGYENGASVILINPNGITFGNGSQVNLNSFTASTRDIKGIDQFSKEIMNTTNVDTGKGYNNYINISGLKNKYGAMTPIVFDKSFVDSKGNGVISLDGSKFNGNGTKAMSVALIGDKININNSKIQTYESNGTSGNIGTGSTRSNVKLITADSVELQYNELGGVADTKNGQNLVKIDDNAQIAAGKTADDYGISITGNSKIYTGSALIDNRYNDAEVKVDDSTVYTTKMYNGTQGDISINSNGKVSLVNSRFETMQGYNGDTIEGAKIKTGAGNITITAKKDINIDNTRIASAPSDYNKGLAYGEDAKAGNITIKSAEGDITVQKSAAAVAAGNHQVSYKGSDGTTKYLPIEINSKGNLAIEAKNGNVITKTLGDKTKLVADHNVYITGKNIDLNTGVYASQQGNLTIKAEQTGGGIKVNDAVLFADKGTVTLGGKETSLINTTLDYGTLNLKNDYNQNNDVLIKDGTTFYDRKVESGEKDTLVIETSGDLIIDHNELKKADFSNLRDQWIATPSNQTANVKLASENGQVSIRNNSNITVDKNIEINGKTNANVTTSNVTSNNGDITMIGGSKVTLGTAIEQAEGDKNVITKKGSTLTANNGNIKLWAKGDTVDPTDPSNTKGVFVLHSKLNAVNNELIADNGDVSVQSGTITASNNNTLTANNGRVGIQKHDCPTYDCPEAIRPETSVVTAGNESNITASGDVIITNSTVKSTNANKITSKNGKTTAKGAGVLVQSTAADVIINQAQTANLDADYDQAKSVKAANNIHFNVNGSGNDINSNGTVGAFSADKRLILNANNNINLAKTTGDWGITRTDMIAGNNITVSSANGINLNDTSFNSNNNTVTAKGNVAISKDMTINKGRTTIKSETGNVKTNADSQINANSNKLIVNAKKDIDIAFTGVDNKAAGLEINSDVNTSNNQVEASFGNAALDGRNVKLNAKDKTLAIAKVKADTLEIVDGNNVKMLAATDNRPNAATDNIGPNGNTANVGTAYIEVKKLAGWNMDTDVENIENIPGFYKEDGHYDQANDGYTQRHFLQFNNEGNNENFLLVYQRATEDCDVPPEITDDPSTVVIPGTDLRESSLVRLPRHEEGVSAVAPVLNEITDPTANVIMAAARITLDEENETDEDGDAIQ